MKECYRCKEKKSVKDFYKDPANKDGLSGWCKECVKKASKEWAKNNKNKVRKAIKKWNKNNRERLLEIQRKGQKKYRMKYPEKARAHSKASSSKIKKVDCTTCGGIENLEYHHPDYSKPLEVVVLCRKCHGKIHNGE